MTDWKKSIYEHMTEKKTSEFLTWGPSKGLGIPRKLDFEGQWDLITELPQTG